MRRFCVLVLTGVVFTLAMFGTANVARASVLARIDLSAQRMYVSVNGVRRYTWRVSTGRRGYRTPVGRYRPWLLRRMHYSSKYNNSPMPHSIFFRGGYAIHGTYQKKSLGRPASHGCVRLHPSHPPGSSRLFAGMAHATRGSSSRAKVQGVRQI